VTRNIKPTRPGADLAPLAVALTLACLAPGCNIAGWAAHGVFGDEEKQKIAARYDGLINRTVAVMVSADQGVLYNFPDAVDQVCRRVSRQLAASLPSTKVIHPRDVLRYQQNHPYWITTPLPRLTESLDVDRIVYVDLVEYRTNDPGDPYVWRGTITANVGVAERPGVHGPGEASGAKGRSVPAEPRATGERHGGGAGSGGGSSGGSTQNSSAPTDADFASGDLAFMQSVTAHYPPGSGVGLVDSDAQTIELGMLKLFSQEVANLFWTRTEMRERTS